MILERDAKRREKLSRHFPVTLTANVKSRDFPVTGMRFQDDYHQIHLPLPTVNLWMILESVLAQRLTSLLMSSGRLLEEVKVMSEPSLVFWIRQAVTKDLTSSSKFSGSCVLTLQPLPS